MKSQKSYRVKIVFVWWPIVTEYTGTIIWLQQVKAKQKYSNDIGWYISEVYINGHWERLVMI